MILDALTFTFALILVIQGATLATKYAAKLAVNYHLSTYIVGFIVVAFISILPETLISINAAIEGVPSFGLGTLFGSNIADLTLIVAVLIFIAGRGIRIQSKVLKETRHYPLFLFMPILLGLNGYYSRTDGILLILIGAYFYWTVFEDGIERTVLPQNGNGKLKNIGMLLLAMVFLLTGSHYTVTSAMAFASELAISPILIGMLVVSLGTTMPELFFSMKSVKKNDDGLAIGDILGTVLADATIVVGILACIRPFEFPAHIVYVTGLFMVLASVMTLRLMSTGRLISKKEGVVLFVFWVCYVIIELMINA